uniref:DUF1758 domain-containing protein n=1 Tax=Trichuris muris TaxID=70415 RepID=A0A5S6Q3D4_TRIMR
MSSAGMDSAERSDESNVQVRNSVPRGTRGARAGMGRGLRRSAPRRTRRSTEEMSELVASSVAREISSQLLPLLEELRRSLNTSSPCEETSAGNAVLTNAASNDTGILIAATAARDADCNGRQTFGRATCTGTSNQPKHDSSLDCAGVNDHSAQASADTVRYERSVREDDWIDAFGGTANDNTQTSTYALCSLSQQLAPAIKIEPFDGDPRNWESFIGSFKVLVHDVIPSNAQRAAILRQLLTPRLRATIGTSLSSPGSYARALKDLRRLFGDPSLVVDASIQDLLRVAPMKSNSKEELEKFFFVVHGIITTLCTKNAAGELESKTTIQILASKLHRNLQSAWAKRVYDLRPRGATLVDFSKFLEEAVMVNNSVFLNGSDNRSSNPSTSVPDNRQRGHLHVMKTERENRNCPLCQGDHSLPACPTFASSSVQRRSEIARDLHRCFNCLNGSHLSRTCRSRSSCNVEGCRGKHHSLLHGASRVYAKLGGPHALKPPQPQEHIEDFHVGASAVTPMDCQVLLAVLPAQIVANGRSCKAMVLLDPGSEATLITEELAFRLGLSGPRRRLRFSTFHGRDPTLVSTSVAFRVSSVDGKRSFDVCNAYTVPQLNVSQRKVDWNTMRSRWNHLKDVQIHAPMGTKVDILLGMDVQDVHEQLQVLKAPGKLTAPVAIETPLGWCIVGKNPLAKRKGDVPTGPRITHVHYRGDAPELDELLPSLWLTESMGTMPMAKPPMSAEDKESIRILNSSIRHTGERYEVGLLWKTPKPALPNNRPAAERRLLYLEKRFAKDVRFARSYEAAIKEYVKNGHAVKVADEDLLSSKNVWFLPHHGVTNINKPGKVRVVFDASAAYNGISLNDCLMKGPDLSTSLAELLLRFRQRPVAVSADIEKMGSGTLRAPPSYCSMASC